MAIYQQALASVVYSNTNPEPMTPGTTREVDFLVFDGTFSSNVLVGFIEIVLVDDNPLTLDCGVGVASFTEEAESPVTLTGSLALSDLDADHVVSGASLAITNAQQGDEISVNSSSLSPSISVRLSNGTHIDLAGRANTMEYQVRYVKQLTARL